MGGPAAVFRVYSARANEALRSSPIRVNDLYQTQSAITGSGRRSISEEVEDIPAIKFSVIIRMPDDFPLSLSISTQSVSRTTA